MLVDCTDWSLVGEHFRPLCVPIILNCKGSLRLTGLWGDHTNGEGIDACLWLLLIDLCS